MRRALFPWDVEPLDDFLLSWMCVSQSFHDPFLHLFISPWELGKVVYTRNFFTKIRSYHVFHQRAGLDMCVGLPEYGKKAVPENV